MLVVLPAPLMPATRMTVGPAGGELQLADPPAAQPASICSRTIASASSAFLILPSRQRSRTAATIRSTLLHAHVGLEKLLLHLGQKRVVDLPARGRTACARRC